ncbi:MAG: sensor histidine kinase [Acidobacteriota bacterium]
MIDLSDSGTGRRAFITLFVVIMALAVSLIGRTWDLTFIASVGALSVLYVAVSVFLGERLDDMRRPGSKALYFVGQFGLLGLLAWVFARNQLYGTLWLFHMPLIAQGRMVLKALGCAAVVVTSLGMMMIHLSSLAGWGEVPNSLFALSTAVAFVLVFTDFAMRESSARAEAQRLSEELEEANRRLSAYAVQAEELSAARERTRMAREIHDSVGHSLTALHMQLQAAEAMLDRDVERARGALEKAQRCAQDGLQEIRHSVSALRSDPLDGRDLHVALSDASDLSTSAGLPVRFVIRGAQRPLSPAITLTLFRAAQEGLTNAKKHARARHVQLSIDYGATSRDGVTLTVEDNGVGTESFSGEASEGGFGLIGLAERARQLDGELTLQSNPGDGARLALTLPTPLEIES